MHFGYFSVFAAVSKFSVVYFPKHLRPSLLYYTKEIRLKYYTQCDVSLKKIREFACTYT